MRGTQTETAFTGHREAVTEMIRAGTPFGEIEEAIDETPDLTTDQQAALWLVAFSLRDLGVHRCDSGAYLADVL